MQIMVMNILKTKAVNDMIDDEIIAICQSKKYNVSHIFEVCGQYTVYVDSRKGVTAGTLFKRFADTPLRVVGFGWQAGEHYILMRVMKSVEGVV